MAYKFLIFITKNKHKNTNYNLKQNLSIISNQNQKIKYVYSVKHLSKHVNRTLN